MFFFVLLLGVVAIVLLVKSQENAKAQLYQGTQSASFAQPSQPVVPPPSPTFVAQGQYQVAGRTITDPLTYFAPAHPYGEASAIDPNAPVGHGWYAEDLPYWPSYANATPNQRAKYLDWLAGGKSDPTIEVGYVFIYFYGLERAVLFDGVDPALCAHEIHRLLAIYGPLSHSFAGYARRLLAFLYVSRLQYLSETDVVDVLGSLVTVEHALDGILAWYHDRGQPLPPHVAFGATRQLEEAKGGIVLERSFNEFFELFTTRYQAKYGGGVALVAAKRPRNLTYRPASASLVNTDLTLSLSNVLGRRAQFNQLVQIWNNCIEDLRRLSRKRAGQEGELTAEMWETLPTELKADIDHPDTDRWADLVTSAPSVHGVHLLEYASLAPLVGISSGEKITAGQAKKIAERAELMGYGLEPDARLVGKGAAIDAPVALWAHRGELSVDAKTYVACRNLLTLLLQIATADGTADEQELDMVEKILEDTFALDDSMRKRLAALREVLLRMPSRGATIAKKIRENTKPKQVESVGLMLVDIAAVDGVLDLGEHKALKSIFRSLGLSNDFLDTALIRAHLRVESREVQMVGGPSAAKGEPITRPAGVQLDRARIARLQAETAEVAKILADVLDGDEDEQQKDLISTQTPAVGRYDALAPRTAAGSASSQGALDHLDERYRAMVALLCQKPEWSMAEAKALTKQHRLMPAAVIEAINEWAEEVHGDVLIEEGDGWMINPDVSQALYP